MSAAHGYLPLVDTVRELAPFAVFAAFMLLFWVRARRDGKDVNTWLRDRNRRTFTNLKPGWWKPHVAFALTAWTALFIASHFKLILLAFLPLVVAWVPFWTLVIRAFYRRSGNTGGE